MAYSSTLHVALEDVLRPHQKERIHVLFGLEVSNPDADYNIRHAKTAIGSGGWTGKGWREGPMTGYGFVPEQETDFIFCKWSEEWGFLGSTTLFILLYAAFLLRIFFLGERQRSRFTRVYAYGLGGILFMHLLINVGMVLGLVPVIGIPLPFMSYGGSSFLAFALMVAVLLLGRRTLQRVALSVPGSVRSPFGHRHIGHPNPGAESHRLRFWFWVGIGQVGLRGCVRVGRSAGCPRSGTAR